MQVRILSRRYSSSRNSPARACTDRRPTLFPLHGACPFHAWPLRKRSRAGRVKGSPRFGSRCLGAASERFIMRRDWNARRRSRQAGASRLSRVMMRFYGKSQRNIWTITIPALCHREKFLEGRIDAAPRKARLGSPRTMPYLGADAGGPTRSRRSRAEILPRHALHHRADMLVG